MAALGPDVELGGEFAFLVFKVQHRHLNWIGFVFVSDEDETWRSIGRDAEAGSQL